jgi:phosphoglucomutase
MPTTTRSIRSPPVGTEEIYKIYAESFKGREHLAAIQAEAQVIVSAALRAAGV